MSRRCGLSAVVPRPPGVLITPEGFERLTRKIPAADKARLVWFPNRLRQTILEPIWSCTNQTELDELGESLGQRLASMCIEFAATIKLFSSDSEAMIRMVEEVEERSLSKARLHISERFGDAVWDSLEWAWNTQMEMMRIALPIIDRLAHGALDSIRQELDNDESSREPELKAGFNMQLYTLAAVAAAERDGVGLPVLTTEYCHRAYTNACTVIDEARRAGIRVDPYRHESRMERRGRIVRTAGQVLAGLSDEELGRVDSNSLENTIFSSGELAKYQRCKNLAV